MGKEDGEKERENYQFPISNFQFRNFIGKWELEIKFDCFSPFLPFLHSPYFFSYFFAKMRKNQQIRYYLKTHFCSETVGFFIQHSRRAC
jgi:hypothetical protein